MTDTEFMQNTKERLERLRDEHNGAVLGMRRF